MMKRKPTSPGEILKEEFLKPLDITQRALAKHLGCDYKVINRIINERCQVTPEIAIKLAEALETTPDFWLNAQRTVDLWSIKRRRPKIRSMIRSRKKLSPKKSAKVKRKRPFYK